VIQTPRLQLIPCAPDDVEAILHDKPDLARRLQVAIPESWPTFPESFDYAYHLLRIDPAAASHGWWVYLFVQMRDRILVGSGGFAAEPDARGAVEIGYEIASEYRNRGLATEAALGLTAYAFAHPEVTAVEAQTLAERNPSTRVLEKVGMVYVGTVYATEDGDLWQWRITRQAFQARYQFQDRLAQWGNLL
jgi:ribosomal-protein-alanine N-acetyltransferase